MFSPTSTNRTFPYRLPLPRRFPLSRKHRPIRPQRCSMISHSASLPVKSTIGAGLHIRMNPLGLDQTIPYSLDLVRQWLIERHQAENVVVHSLRDDAVRSHTIECRWTSKPRLGQKNRAFLAAHGIQV